MTKHTLRKAQIEEIAILIFLKGLKMGEIVKDGAVVDAKAAVGKETKELSQHTEEAVEEGVKRLLHPLTVFFGTKMYYLRNPDSKMDVPSIYFESIEKQVKEVLEQYLSSRENK